MEKAKSSIFLEKSQKIKEIFNSDMPVEEKYSKLISKDFTLRQCEEIFKFLFPNKAIKRGGTWLFLSKFNRGIIDREYLAKSYLDMPLDIDWVGNEEKLGKFPLI